MQTTDVFKNVLDAGLTEPRFLGVSSMMKLGGSPLGTLRMQASALADISHLSHVLRHDGLAMHVSAPAERSHPSNVLRHDGLTMHASAPADISHLSHAPG